MAVDLALAQVHVTNCPPSFRLSLLDAAADYLEEGMHAAAERRLELLVGGSDDDLIEGWLRRMRAREDSEVVIWELRAEVARLRLGL